MTHDFTSHISTRAKITLFVAMSLVCAYKTSFAQKSVRVVAAKSAPSHVLKPTRIETAKPHAPRLLAPRSAIVRHVTHRVERFGDEQPDESQPTPPPLPQPPNPGPPKPASIVELPLDAPTVPSSDDAGDVPTPEPPQKNPTPKPDRPPETQPPKPYTPKPVAPPLVPEKVERDAEPIARPEESTKQKADQVILGRPGIGSVVVDIRLADEGKELPKDVASNLFANQQVVSASSDFPSPSQTGLSSGSTGSRRMPVYFEEENFERHGTSRGILQPVVSGAHFFKNVAVLPYKMAVEPPRQTRYYDYPYQAGRAAPRYYRPYPLQVDAGVAEAALIIGLIALIP